MDAVAPLAGAWIETDIKLILSIFNMSRPSRARGLKLTSLEIVSIFKSRAPRGRVD